MENKVLYCHFSFRRKKGDIVDGKPMGIFAVAFYLDQEGKELLWKKVVKKPLWENHQFVTAVQSYENALSVIHECQNAFINYSYTHIYLVTDNSTLAGWILDPRKNKQHSKDVERAICMYRQNGPKPLALSIGLADTRDYEKSYKFCKEEFVEYEEEIIKKDDRGHNAYDMSKIQYTRVADLIAQEDAEPKIDGMTEL